MTVQGSLSCCYFHSGCFFPSLLELTIAMQGSTLDGSPTSHVCHGNFRCDAFHYLQAEKLTSIMVENELECIFLCVEETKCYSLNLAVYPDSKGLHLCELLATDKYKATKHFLANDTFHHHRPGVSICWLYIYRKGQFVAIDFYYFF